MYQEPTPSDCITYLHRRLSEDPLTCSVFKEMITHVDGMYYQMENSGRYSIPQATDYLLSMMFAHHLIDENMVQYPMKKILVFYDVLSYLLSRRRREVSAREYLPILSKLACDATSDISSEDNDDGAEVGRS